MSVRPLADIAALVDLDVVSLGGSEDLFPGPFLRRLALEIGLVESRNGVARVRLVMDREMFATVAIDVRELISFGDGPVPSW